MTYWQDSTAQVNGHKQHRDEPKGVCYSLRSFLTNERKKNVRNRGIKNVTAVFHKNISRTSAVSSTNFWSILIFASCVVGTCNTLGYVGEFFHNGRGHFVLLKNKHTYIYEYIHIL